MHTLRSELRAGWLDARRSRHASLATGWRIGTKAYALGWIAFIVAGRRG